MAIIFNGTDQYAHALEAFAANNSGIDQTVAFFVRPQTPVAAGYPVTVSDADQNFLFFGGRVQATPEIAARHKTTADITTTYSALTNDAWTPVVITFEDATNTLTLYVGSATGVTATGSPSTLKWDAITIGAAYGTGSTPADFFKGKVAYAMYFERLWSGAEVSAFVSAAAVADIDAISTTSRVARYDLIADGNADGAGVGLTLVGTPAFDSDDPLAGVTTTPGISSKTLERAGVAVTATTAAVFVWAGHGVDIDATAAAYKATAATLTSGVLADIDLSSAGLAVGNNITVVVRPATGGPGIIVETTVEELV